MTQKIRVGIIGCGGISWGHCERLLATGKAEIVAGTEPIPSHFDRIKHFMNEGAPCFATHQEMLADMELDAAVISSPHDVHYEQILACMEKDLHILCEKPMVCTVDHAKDVCARVNASDKVFAVSYQRHYESQFRYIKDAIAKGDIGKVQFVSALQAQDWYESQKGLWRQEMARSCGGQLNDSGSHLVDIVLWITGLSAKSVFSKVEFFDREVDINSSTTIEFDNGALGSLSIIGRTPMSFNEDISIMGSEGSFLMRPGHPLRHWDSKGKEFTIGTREMPKHSNPDEAFINAIFDGIPVLTPAECGLRVIELTENIWKSGETGQLVKIS